MTIREYQGMFYDMLEPEVVYAGEFLEARGYVFGVDFGPTNAINYAACWIIGKLGI